MRIDTCRATRDERQRPLLGDELVPEPILATTHAIDLAVPPDEAWPWLVQMGAGRAGWYSWDGLDNAACRSADRIIPSLQHIRVGDVLPATPGARDAFVVQRVEAPRDLVLDWPADDGRSRVSWEFLLSPAPRGSRLVVRARLGPLALAAADGSDTSGAADGRDRNAAADGQESRPVRQGAAERLEHSVLRLPRPLMRPIGFIGHRVMQARQLRELKRRIEGRQRRWWLHWGATAADLAREMPGDELVVTPVYESTRAIDVRARRSEIWPWLVQMGRGRGGLYSIDWIDRAFGLLDSPSADRVLPQWQDLRTGDVIPVGDSSWPVHMLDRERTLVLHVHEGDVSVTQSWTLTPLDSESTHVVLRVRCALPTTPRNRALLMLLAPQEALMVRAQLLGIRRRAEALAANRRGDAARASELRPG